MKGFGGNTLGIFCVIYEINIPLRKFFFHRNLKQSSPAHIVLGKFFRNKADPEIAADGGQNHIGSGKFNVRVKDQTVLRKIMIQKITGYGFGGKADPGIVPKIFQGSLFSFQMQKFISADQYVPVFPESFYFQRMEF